MGTPVFDERAQQPTAPRPRHTARDAQRPSGNLSGAPQAYGIPEVLALRSRIGNRATSAVIQRLGEGSGKDGGKKASGAGKGFRQNAIRALDRAGEHLNVIDTFVLRGESPADSGIGWWAGKTANTRLSNQVAASGTAANAEMGLADGVATVGDVLGAHKAYKDVKANPDGPAYHAPHKNLRTKTVDAIKNLVATSTDIIAAARNGLATQAVATAPGVAEAGGAAFGALTAFSSIRAGVRTVLTGRKYRAIKKIDVPAPVGEDELARLRAAKVQKDWAFAEAYLAIERAHEGGEQGLAERLIDGLDQVTVALGAIEKAAGELKSAQDTNALNTTRSYALGKQRTKAWKLGISSVGEGTRSAGTGVGIAAVVTGTMASNPAGWALAATAAGLLLSVTAYKAGRAGKKRYDGARHPDRWAPPTQDGGGTAAAQPASHKDALKEALKFWKKVENGQRQAMARTIYGLAAGPDVPAGKDTTPELRTSARQLLIALKSSPTKLKMSEDAWVQSLNNPADAEKWLKEITNQLSSG